MQNDQLKESLLGWGGYKDVQNKIGLTNRVVYMRGNRQSSTGYTNARCIWQTGSTIFYTSSRNPDVGDLAFSAADPTNEYRVMSYDENTDKVSIVGSNSYYGDLSFNGYTPETNNCEYTVYSEKVFLVNIDGTSNNTVFVWRFDSNDTVKNERFYFDKVTQCLIRVAYDEFGVKNAALNRYGTLKIVVFDTFNPNTGIRLDHHVIWGFSDQKLNDENVIPNCLQSLYSVYLNGFCEAGSTRIQSQQPATVFLYSARQRKVYQVPVGNIITVPSVGSTFTSNKSGDALISAYNNDESVDSINSILLTYFCPSYTSTRPTAYLISVDLETNPATMVISTSRALTSQPYTAKTPLYDRYPIFPASVVGFMNYTTNNNYAYLYALGNTYSSTSQTDYVIGDLTLRALTTSQVSTIFATDNKFFSGVTSGINYADISSNGWFGKIGVITFGLSSGINGSFLITNSELTTPVTNSSLFPRLFLASKYKNLIPISIEQSGSLFKVVSGATTILDINKVTSDQAWVGCFVSADPAAVSIYNIMFCIISKTSEGARITDRGTEKPVTKITYKNQDYYLSNAVQAWAVNNLEIINTADIPLINVNYLIKFDDLLLGYYMFSALDGNLYTNGMFIKDYYNNGSGNLSYKVNNSDTTYTLSLYDSVSGNSATTFINELSVVPFTETYTALSAQSVASSSLARYFNLISFEPDSTGLRIKPVIIKLDAYTNSQYQGNNAASTTATSDGGMAIPPVAIADGDLEVPPTKPAHFYAWSRYDSNSQTYKMVFTDSLDPNNVIGKAYYWKGDTNEFYQDGATNENIIAAITSTYIATKAGVEYTRSMTHDWDLKTSTQEYVPTYLQGWRA